MRLRLIGAIGDDGSSGGHFSFKIFDDQAIEEAEYVIFFVEIVVHYSKIDMVSYR